MRIGCCTKTEEILYITYSDSQLDQIAFSDIPKDLKIEVQPNIQEGALLSLHSIVFPVDHCSIISRWIGPLELDIIVLSTGGNYCLIKITSTKGQITTFAFPGLPQETTDSWVPKSNQYNIQIKISQQGALNIEFECTDNKHKTKIDVSAILPTLQGPKKVTATTKLSLRGNFVSNLVDAFTTSNADKKEHILNQITLLLSKDQQDMDKRLIGLDALQQIYNSGSYDLINRLWKACKNSFDIQPYNIIDINELTINKEKLGSGTFGSVQTGVWHSPSGNISVAIKLIQENSEMFDLSDLRGEFVALSLLNHPNIIPMFGGGYIKDSGIQSSSIWFIVMELMDGNLAQLIHSSDQYELTMEEKIRIAKHAAEGLAHLHHHKVIHRDIKPENVLFKMESRKRLIKIADLGVCKPSTDTIKRTVIGTHGYMAPELTQNRSKLTQFGDEVDIYSFGIVIWELFTGNSVDEFHTKFKSSGRFRLSKSQSNTPNWIYKLISQCTNKYPSKRPSAGEVVTILNEKLDSSTAPKNLSSSYPISQKLSFDNTNITERDTEAGEAIWYYQKLNRSLWQRFGNIAHSSAIEVGYQKFLLTGESKVSLDFCGNSIASCSVDFHQFSLVDESKNIVNYVRRRRMKGEKNSSVCVNCELQENGSFLVTVKGDTVDDCTDVLISVTYCFKILDKVSFSTDAEHSYETIRSSPYCVSIPPNPGWIYVLLDFEFYFPQILEIELVGKSTQTTLEFSQLKPMKSSLVNSFPKYSTKSFTEIYNKAKIFAKARSEQIIKIVHIESKKILERAHNHKFQKNEFTLFRGFSGFAYLLWRVAKSEDLFDSLLRFQCLDIAGKLIKVSADSYTGDFSNIGFMHGYPGIFALQSVILFFQNEIEQCQVAIRKLFGFQQHFLVPEMFDKELMYGFAGYMASILFVIKHVSEEILDMGETKRILIQCFHFLCVSSKNQVLFKYRNHLYAGYAHGLSGVLFVLLHLPEEVKKNENLIKSSLDSLMVIYDSSVESKLEINCEDVNWYNGSIVSTLLKGYQVFGDSKYLEGAILGAAALWERGLVRKGFDLLCGISGNGYTFLQMYETREEKYLYYAAQFVNSFADPRICINVTGYKYSFIDSRGKASFPNSLMEGIVGECCFLLDIHSPTSSCFPGYWNDL